MAYRDPAFYFFHALREATESNITLSPAEPANAFPLHDSRQGELMQFTTNLTAGDKTITVTRADTPENDALDALIISGHNLNGNDIDVAAGANDMLDPNHTVTAANGLPIVIDLTATVDVSVEADVTVTLKEGGGSGATVPEMTELFLTTKHQLGRGLDSNRSQPHPWRRTQRRFLNDAAVSSTLLLGSARQTWVMSWRDLSGDDRQVLLDLREQTNDWSEPFWFLPPDTEFPILFMELDRDAGWELDLPNPQSDAVTLPMIEVKG